MQDWQRFKSGKARGEWAELQFMAAAAQRQFRVCKPWGETAAYDVGVDYGINFLRVQVINRRGRGYWCDLTRYYKTGTDYTLEEVDLFAAYVIPEDVWYLIPMAVLQRDARKGAMLFPVERPVNKNSFHYERYMDGWGLLTKTRRGLAAYGG